MRARVIRSSPTSCSTSICLRLPVRGPAGQQRLAAGLVHAQLQLAADDADLAGAGLEAWRRRACRTSPSRRRPGRSRRVRGGAGGQQRISVAAPARRGSIPGPRRRAPIRGCGRRWRRRCEVLDRGRAVARRAPRSRPAGSAARRALGGPPALRRRSRRRTRSRAPGRPARRRTRTRRGRWAGRAGLVAEHEHGRLRLGRGRLAHLGDVDLHDRARGRVDLLAADGERRAGRRRHVDLLVPTGSRARARRGARSAARRRRPRCRRSRRPR